MSERLFSQLAKAGIQPCHLVNDSRAVGPGDVFVAYPGETSDGRRFIPNAIHQGAVAIMYEKAGGRWLKEWNVPHQAILGLREEIGAIASEFYGNPSQDLWAIGVTGTNGKTSCSHWLAQCMQSLGLKTAVVGTLGNGFPGSWAASANTTPDAIKLQRMLKEFVSDGAEALAMEVSSHGLSQGRVNGTKFDIAVLTNLSRDHLDYHGDMQSYAAAKSSLFDWPRLKSAVLNSDDELGRQLALKLHARGQRVLTYGIESGAVSCTALRFLEGGIAMEVMTPWGRAEMTANVLGRFNAYNLLAVLATLLASNISLSQALAAMDSIQPIPGRMQQLGGAGKPVVVVDYAHTPDALAKVLSSLREQTVGRLFCVFGCGGNRDKGKRPQMGEVASQLADQVVITSDNPRHEVPRSIIDDIVAGMSGNYQIEEDRAAAIEKAIHLAKPGDVVLLAGKGHETYQHIGNEKLPFNDAEVAQRVLNILEGAGR